MNKRRQRGMPWLLGAALLAAAASPWTASGQNSSGGPRDQVLFRNGDSLFGKLLAVTTNQVLQWENQDAPQPMGFIVDSVAEVDFGARAHAPAENEGCKVLFANGDILRGKFVSADADNIVLDVTGAGRLRLPRNRLQSLAMIPKEPPIFDGITGMEGWTEVSSPVGAGEAGHWTYRNGAFYADKSASLARNFKLPDMSRIAFDLAWRGQANLAIALYTDSLQPIMLLNKENGPDFGAFYSFRLGGIVADMYPIKKHGASVSLGSVILSALTRTDHAHFELCSSKAQDRILLLVDGALVMQWTDPNGFEGEGSGLRFVDNGGAVRLSNLQITRWDGIVPVKSDQTVRGSSDVLWLQNGSNATGAIVAMNDQTITLRGAGGNKVIPLSTARDIDFAAPSPAPPVDSASVRAMFVQGGSIHAQLESWTPEGATFRSAEFGRAKFDPSLFSALQFAQNEGN